MSAPSLHFSREALIPLTSQVFKVVGLNADFAFIQAENSVCSERRGHDAHGVTPTPIYTKRFRRGVVNCRPNIRIKRRSASTSENGVTVQFSAPVSRRPTLPWSRCAAGVGVVFGRALVEDLLRLGVRIRFGSGHVALMTAVGQAGTSFLQDARL